MICSICRQKPAQFTDSTESVYCGQLCQITGNLTVLMSNPRWNKDTLILLMKPLTKSERLILLDLLLKDALPNQRNRLIQWIPTFEQDGLIEDVIFACIFAYDDGLQHLLFYYPKFTDKDIQNISGQLWDRNISFTLFTIMLGKLTSYGKTTKGFLLDLLEYLVINREDEKVEYILRQYRFSDWVIELLASTQRNLAVFSEHIEINQNYHLGQYRKNATESIFTALHKSNHLFKNPAKRNKHGE